MTDAVLSPTPGTALCSNELDVATAPREGVSTRQRITRVALPIAGLTGAVALWALGVHLLEERTPIAAMFAPWPSAQALWTLLSEGHIWPHAQVSMIRVLVGLLAAVAIGVPLGLLVGTWRPFAQATTPLFQLLRMISPLSWMPLAVMVLGIGDAPVYFLLAFAAVWPIMLNTAAGVAQLNPHWMLLAQSLSATRWEIARRVILPGITTHILTGIRLAIGLIWIVLVPAEMLGVSAGLGYYILDTRDRLAYDELMAVILFIGVIGYALDTLARALHARSQH